MGSTAVGVQCSDGVILAVEKRLKSTLLEPQSVEKIMEIDTHIGVAVAGLIGGVFRLFLFSPRFVFFIFLLLDFFLLFFMVYP